MFAGAALVLCLPPDCRAAAEPKQNETGFYRDVFDQNVYYEGTRYLNLDKFYRALFHKKVRAADINAFDEVPDNAFFSNRHGRQRLSAEELSRGGREATGPDLNGALTVTGGKFEGLAPVFTVRDARGEDYIFKFDIQENMEMATAAEVIASRFYHAAGYYVPQYSIAVFPSANLVPAPEARIMDDSGFSKKLTPQKMDEFKLFLPQTEDGRYRSSAGKVVPGKNLGYFAFQGRNKSDAGDRVDHENRRAVRALWVFSSWLNNTDVREGNTMTLLTESEGRRDFRYFIFDFNSALGANGEGAKVPMLTHEYLFDYGEMLKTFLTMGWWEKPWQKRLREAEGNAENAPSPAVGYFDNRYFQPGKYKTQLPHEVFKLTTRADGFWAAKIIMAFSDADIREMVKTGRLSRPEDADYLVKTLSERRDLIGKYWFKKANPLDEFVFSANTLNFKDLAVEYRFEPKEGVEYRAEVIGKKGNKGNKLTTLDSREPVFSIDPALFSEYDGLDLLIRVFRKGISKSSPYVLVQLDRQAVKAVVHED